MPARARPNKTKTKSNETQAAATTKNLANEEFRKEYGTFLNNANKKKSATNLWEHKKSCLAHEIMPILITHFGQSINAIPKICQCGQFEEEIDRLERQYRVPMADVLKPPSKTAYHDDLTITINGHTIKINMMSVKAGEIKKMTQPNSRKFLIGTGTFSKGRSIVSVGDKYFIEFRLKTRYHDKEVKIGQDKPVDVAKFWFQNVFVTGIWHFEKNMKNGPMQLFIAIHNNPYVGDSWKECAARIVMNVYAKDDEAINMCINGNSSFKTCEELELLNKEKANAASSPSSSPLSSSPSISLSQISNVPSTDSSSVSSIQCSDNRKKKSDKEKDEKILALEMAKADLERQVMELKEEKNKTSDHVEMDLSQSSSQGSQACVRGYSRSRSMDDIINWRQEMAMEMENKAVKSENKVLRSEKKVLKNKVKMYEKYLANPKESAQFSKRLMQDQYVHFCTPPDCTPPNDNDDDCKEPLRKKRRIQ